MGLERTTQRKSAEGNEPLLNRRKLLGLGASAAGVLLFSSDNQRASAFDGGSGDEPTPEPVEQFDIERSSLATLLKPDPELAKRINRPTSPITDMIFSRNEANFEGLEPSSPKERTDMAIHHFFAMLESNRQEATSLPNQLDSTNFEGTATAQRAISLSVNYPWVTPEQIQENLQDPNYSLPIWAYEEGEKDKENVQLFDIDANLGIYFRIGNDQPLVTLIPAPGSATDNPKAAYGFTPTVFEKKVKVDGKEVTKNALKLTLYSADESNYRLEEYIPPDRYCDMSTTAILNQAIEAYGVLQRPEYINRYYMENYVLQVLPNSPEFVLFPEVAGLLSGPVTPGFPRYNGAPVFNILSPSVPRGYLGK